MGGRRHENRYRSERKCVDDPFRNQGALRRCCRAAKTKCSRIELPDEAGLAVQLINGCFPKNNDGNHCCHRV